MFAVNLNINVLLTYGFCWRLSLLFGSYIEANWPYFIGFGLPLTVITMYPSSMYIRWGFINLHHQGLACLEAPLIKMSRLCAYMFYCPQGCMKHQWSLFSTSCLVLLHNIHFNANLWTWKTYWQAENFLAANTTAASSLACHHQFVFKEAGCLHIFPTAVFVIMLGNK